MSGVQTLDPLTTRALSTAAALLDAATKGDRWTMRSILRGIHEPATNDTIGNIVRAASMAYNVDVGHLLGGVRRPPVVRARMATCYIAVELFGHGYAQTGRDLGCDHTTVMHAVRRISADPERKAEAEAIAGRVGWVEAS